MDLNDIKGTYNGIFSLGHNCLVGIQLRKNNLRPFAGVLDWVGSPSLPNVSRLLQNRFSGFLELPNLKFISYASNKDLLIGDEAYKIYFNHDFKTDINTPTNLAGYPDVKEKYNRRVARFLEKLSSSQRLLFIRTEGKFEEVRELEKVLTGIVKNDFRILVVNHTNVKGIVQIKWPLQKVCVIELPNNGFNTNEMFSINDHYWKTILQGIQITP